MGRASLLARLNLSVDLVPFSPGALQDQLAELWVGGTLRALQQHYMDVSTQAAFLLLASVVLRLMC